MWLLSSVGIEARYASFIRAFGERKLPRKSFPAFYCRGNQFIVIVKPPEKELKIWEDFRSPARSRSDGDTVWDRKDHKDEFVFKWLDQWYFSILVGIPANMP